jgi:hypothetical protein
MCTTLSDRLADRFVRRWLGRRKPLRDGVVALVGYALSYALCLLLLAIGGARPGTAPWLTIPEEVYFWWESTFIAPVIVCGAVLAAALLHLIARASGGTGDFDRTMAAVAFATAFASLSTLVPDTIIALLLCTHFVDAEAWMHAITSPSVTLYVVWAYLALYVIAFATLFPAVARVVQGLRGWRAYAVGWTAFAVYQLLLYVFVR